MKAGTEGGIEAVVKAINTQIDSTDICKDACGALWNMTANNGKNIGKQGQQIKI